MCASLVSSSAPFIPFEIVSKSYDYYRRSGIMDKTCSSKNYRAEVLEDKVISSLKQFFGDRENYEILINDFFDTQIKSLKEGIQTENLSSGLRR